MVRRRVETDEQGAALGCIGSPTVLVDGRDPFAAGSENVRPACRVFTTAEGLVGAPTMDQLVEVLS